MTITISSCSGLYLCIFLMFCCHPQSSTPQIIKWELWTSQLHIETTSVLHSNSYISPAPPAEAVHPFSFWDLKSIYDKKKKKKQNKNTAVLSQQHLFFQMLMLWDYATVKVCARALVHSNHSLGLIEITKCSTGQRSAECTFTWTF